jgi:5-methylthioribose kinase
MSYRALSEDHAKEYALNLSNLFPADAQLISREIGDGNLNLVFHLQDRTSGKSVIFKQALPYARVVGESWPLTLDRARIESEVLIKQRELCPALVPEVYHYDSELALTIMEDLSDHVILRKGLTDGNQYPLLAEDIGHFLARTLFYQSDFHLTPDVKKSLVSQFINPELCKITEDLVFTDPYYDAETNSFNPLILQDVQYIWEDRELKKEIAQLKYKFLTSAETLIHGDLHTGSIFVTEKSTKVIDPEFAYYGPMGFDIGAVLANLILNYAAQEAHIKDNQERDTFHAYLLESIDSIWDTFEKEFRLLSAQESNDLSLKDPLFIDQFLLQVKGDAFGFAGCKVLRRVIGLASVADLESISDPELRAQSERLALYIGRQLVLNRTSWSTAQSLSTSIIASLHQREEKVS